MGFAGEAKGGRRAEGRGRRLMAATQPLFVTPPVAQTARPVVPRSAPKARKKPVDAFTAAIDDFDQDLGTLLGDLGGEVGQDGASSAKRQKTEEDPTSELLELIERRKQELLQKKT